MSADTRTPWGSTIVTEVVTSLAGVEPPTWMDISDRVSFRDLGQVTVTNGRQSDLSGDEPAQLSIAFRDDDHLFTVGDILRTGRRIRIRESFGLATFDLIDAEIQVPSTSTAMDVADATHQAEITVTVTATDQLGRLRDARRFISTLSEYIRFAGTGNGLLYHWPLHQTAGPFPPAVGPAGPLVATGYNKFTNDNPISIPVNDTPYLTIGGAPAIFADDKTPPRFVNDLSGVTIGTGAMRGQYLKGPPLPITLSASTLTVACWVYPDTSRSPHAGVPEVFNIFSNNAADGQIEFYDDGGGGGWAAMFAVSTSFFNPVGLPALRPNAWNLVALSLSLPSGACTAYMHNVGTATGTLSGSPPASASFSDVFSVAKGLEGAVSDVQVYLGTNAYTQATHNAQILAATTGLEQQLTGERVNTILDYAGVPAGTRDIDPGVATMSVARLAGKDPLTCLEEARRTEQGRLFSTGSFGSRRIQFRDRQRSYNN